MNFDPIIVVAGEPKSIFFEIFFKALKKKKIKSPLILISCKRNLKKSLSSYKIKKKLVFLKKDTKQKKFENDKLYNVYVEYKKSLSKKNNNTSDYLHLCFKIAFNFIKNGVSNKILNGPINKKTFLKKKYLGVTEYIAKHFEVKNYGMLIYNEKLSVSPVTTHLPIKLVSKKITGNAIKKQINLIEKFYLMNLKKLPLIGVTGLNPHCESIEKFNEDEKIVTKVIKKLNKKNIIGPISADTVFLKNNRKKFDVILGMYHDQVLSPMKALFEFDAINITMGLPFVRVSPDHGPNESMVGKNKSNPISMIKALTFLDRR